MASYLNKFYTKHVSVKSYNNPVDLIKSIQDSVKEEESKGYLVTINNNTYEDYGFCRSKVTNISLICTIEVPSNILDQWREIRSKELHEKKIEILSLEKHYYTQEVYENRLSKLHLKKTNALDQIKRLKDKDPQHIPHLSTLKAIENAEKNIIKETEEMASYILQDNSDESILERNRYQYYVELSLDDERNIYSLEKLMDSQIG